MDIVRKINNLYYPNKTARVLPAVVMVEPTNMCNLRCSMCYVQQRSTGIKHYLSVRQFKDIVEQFQKIRELIFCGIGEPLLNADIFEMIKLARHKGAAFINLITNGKLLNKDTALRVVASGIDRIQISVHSFNPEVFAKVRNENQSNLENLIENIRYLIELRNKMNAGLKISCNVVITKFNYDDMLKLLKYAKELKIDKVEFIQLTTAYGALSDINAPFGQMPRIIREIRRVACKLNIKVGFLSGNECGRCYQLWDFVMVHADGNISPCNGIFPTENVGVGNIFLNPLQEIWNSKKYQDLRSLVSEGKLQNCKFCESGYCLEGKDFRWFKNYYLRPIKRLIKHSLLK